MQITPEIVTTGILLLTNLFTYIREKNTKAALETVVDGVEVAARLRTDPKTAVAVQQWKPAAKAVLDSVLTKKRVAVKRRK
jgi:hypothetical protein